MNISLNKLDKESIIGNLIILIISLFPFFFITGPFLTDLNSIIIGIIFLFTISKEKKWQECFNNYYFIFFLVIFFYLNLNSFFSFNKEISFSKSLPFIRIIIFIFALSFFLQRFTQIYKYFFYCFVFFISLMLLDSFIQLLSGFNIFGSKIDYQNRISSLFGDELIMGSYITRLLPIIVSIVFIIDYKKKYFINIIILIISTILVFLSAERLAMFYLVSFLIFYFLIIKKYFFKFFVTILFLIFLIHYNNPNFTLRIVDNTIKQIRQTESITSYRHSLHYKTAFDMFLDKKIFGYGLKAFRYICSDYKYENLIKEKQEKDILRQGGKAEDYVKEYKNGCNTHPHNIYLEFLSELGIIGFLLFFTIFLYALFNIINFIIKFFIFKINDNLIISKNLILFGIFIQMFPLVPSGSYFNNYMLLIFHISVGFYLSLMKIKK